MQGAVHNDKKIFTVPADEANVTFKSSRESNNDLIAESYITEKDEMGRRLTKPLRVLEIEPENVFALREEEETHAAAYHSFVNDENDASKPVPYRIAPWKPMPFVFENGSSVSRVWWCSIGKAKVTTDTARLREEYESDNRPLAASLVLLPDVVLSPEDLRTLKAEWEEVLKGFKLHVLKRGTRETRAIPTTRQTTKGRRARAQQAATQERMSSVAHDLASGVKVNTLIQREIRQTRKAKEDAKYASLPDDEIQLLSRYVDNRKSAGVDLLCEGGCFALVELHHLELKRLGAYAATAGEVSAAMERERRVSLRRAAKYQRKKSNPGQEDLQGRIDSAQARINLAYEAAEVFRRGHCIDHG